jgi:hypothetical protein
LTRLYTVLAAEAVDPEHPAHTWFVERYLRPGGIDQAIDPMMRGSIAHVALQRFYKELPSALPGAERVTRANVEAAVELMHRCVASALDSGLRIDAAACVSHLYVHVG